MLTRDVEQFEKQLKHLFDGIDDEIETKWGDMYALHPARPSRGSTGNKEHDGLFNIGASFSPGYGSKLGRGYVVEVRIATLEHVQEDIRTKIQTYVFQRIQQLLTEYFPGQNLVVEKEGIIFKITGDFSPI